MRRLERAAWITIGIMAIAVIAGYLTGCAEQQQSQTVNIDTPVVRDWAFVRRAEVVLAAAPKPAPGWRVGVILSEHQEDADGNDWIAGVDTLDGLATISADRWSFDCEKSGKAVARDTFPTLLDPGDLITWAGDDRTNHFVCAEDMKVLTKAAVK